MTAILDDGTARFIIGMAIGGLVALIGGGLCAWISVLVGERRR